MEQEPPFEFEDAEIYDDSGAYEERIRKLCAEADALLTPEARERIERKAEIALRAELLELRAKPQEEERVEVNGMMLTRREWKEYMEDCPHESFSHPGVTLMDGSRMSICNRCKFIQHEAIAKMIEGGED